MQQKSPVKVCARHSGLVFNSIMHIELLETNANILSSGEKAINPIESETLRVNSGAPKAISHSVGYSLSEAASISPLAEKASDRDRLRFLKVCCRVLVAIFHSLILAIKQSLHKARSLPLRKKTTERISIICTFIVRVCCKVPEETSYNLISLRCLK